MPDAAYVAANKATSEARKLLLKLQLAGHSTADIARAIGTESSKLRDIRKGSTRGDQWIIPLQRLMAEVKAPAPAADSTGGTPAAAAPDAPPEADTDAPTGGTLPADLGAVEAPPMTPTEPQGLAARLKGLMLGTGNDAAPSAPVARVRVSGGGKSELQAQFVQQVLPVVALVVAWGSELAIKDPYKPCAPSVQEASAMLAVPIRRVARELDVRHKLTEGTMDIVLMFLAVAAYGKRAQATYKQIRGQHATQESATSGGASRDSGASPASLSGGAGIITSAAAPVDAVPSRATAAPGNARGRGLFGSRQPGSHDGGAPTDARGLAHGVSGGHARAGERGGPDPLDDVLRADYEGRLRLGMVG